MATPINRSPWQVKLPGKDATRFRLKSQALAHLAALGFDDPTKLPKNSLKQLETAFEVQIKFKDKDGNEVKRSGTHDTYEQAKKWASQQEALLNKIRRVLLIFGATIKRFAARSPAQQDSAGAWWF